MPANYQGLKDAHPTRWNNLFSGVPLTPTFIHVYT